MSQSKYDASGGLRREFNALLTDYSTNIGMSCSSLGMIPNDASKATVNYTKLASALSKGKKVLVDGVYYVSKLDKTDSAIELSKNVVLVKGNTADAKIIFTLEGDYFNLKGQSLVHLEGIELNTLTDESNNTDYFHIFTCSPYFYIGNVQVVNCIFRGRMSLFDYVGGYNIDLDVYKVGVGNFYFTDNRVYDLEKSFVHMIDCPHENVFVLRNSVNNFKYIFLEFGMSVYDAKIAVAMKNMVVEHNIVKCGVDWWGNTDSSYYCFIIYEGCHVKYGYNHIEGMKTEGNIALYDAYLSAEVVEYYDNYWRNNICFNAEKANVHLMECKGGASTAGTRVYRNNKYIIDESFCTTLSKDPSLSWVTLYQVTEDFIHSFDILDNEISVYELRLLSSSIGCKNINISNNVFKSTLLTGTLSYYNILAEVDYTDASCIINNNVIRVKDFGVAITNKLQLLRMIDNSGGSKRVRNVYICGNRIDGPLQYMIYSVYCDRLTLTENDVRIINRNSFSISYTGIASSVLARNNTFSSTGIIGNPGIKFGSNEVLFEYIKNSSSNVGTTYLGFVVQLIPYDPSAVTTRVTQELTLQMFDGVRTCQISFEYGYNLNSGDESTWDRNYIKFLDESDVETTVHLNRMTGEDPFTTGTGSYIKTTYSSPLADGLRFRLTNSDTGPRFWPVSTLTADKRIIGDVRITCLPM